MSIACKNSTFARHEIIHSVSSQSFLKSNISYTIGGKHFSCSCSAYVLNPLSPWFYCWRLLKQEKQTSPLNPSFKYQQRLQRCIYHIYDATFLEKRWAISVSIVKQWIISIVKLHQFSGFQIPLWLPYWKWL